MSGDGVVDATSGVAYGRAPATFDPELVHVGPGTPLGELMRRYWHPVAISGELGGRPQKIRILGEDLVLFRDSAGHAGLITPRCIHRGSPMIYGRVEERGIRCAYHGWLFDTQGRCLDQPCEPRGGVAKDKFRQPWYPVEERYGLVFAYMGPPEKKPVLPRWEAFENIGPDEKISPDSAAFSVGGDESVSLIPWAWMQDWENTMDPYHVSILHTAFSGPQFSPNMAVTPETVWKYSDIGMFYSSYRKLPDGREVDRVTHVVMPNIRSVPNVALSHGEAESMGWLVPVDDNNHRTFHITRMPKSHQGVPLVTAPTWPDNKKWSEMTEDEQWLTPGDWEIQSGLGENGVTLHSAERLATSDEGVVMLRRLLKKQIKVVQAGGDPIGVTFDPAAPPIRIGAGNFDRRPPATEGARSAAAG
jgi:phenylpropionate dioxygenase-like ring-hydroxylating dioxygenase large terminal subunit